MLRWNLHTACDVLGGGASGVAAVQGNCALIHPILQLLSTHEIFSGWRAVRKTEAAINLRLQNAGDQRSALFRSFEHSRGFDTTELSKLFSRGNQMEA